MRFYSYKKRGGDRKEVLAMPIGVTEVFIGSLNTGAFSHIEGGCKMFPSFKRGLWKSFTLS